MLLCPSAQLAQVPRRLGLLPIRKNRIELRLRGGDIRWAGTQVQLGATLPDERHQVSDVVVVLRKLGLREYDRVCGKGFVDPSAVLGDIGVGEGDVPLVERWRNRQRTLRQQRGDESLSGRLIVARMRRE